MILCRDCTCICTNCTVCIPLIDTVTTGPIAVYHFSLIKEITAVIAVAIISSIEMMDSDRTALNHAGTAIHEVSKQK